MKLKRKEAGSYVTEDGRFEVSRSPTFTECDNPHPVQIARETRWKIHDMIHHQGQGVRLARMTFGNTFVDAVLDGKRGYFCEGGEEHWRDSWGVWDVAKDDYVPGGEDFDTKQDAVEFLEGHIKSNERVAA